MRIASLLPAGTEIVAALGLEDRLVAVTFECDEPTGIRGRVPVVVDTALPAGLDPAAIDAFVRDRVARGRPLYELDRAALRAAEPTLILTQDLCRVCALPGGTVADALTALELDCEVCSLDPHTVTDVLAAIAEVGRRAGTSAAVLLDGLRRRLADVAARVAPLVPPRVLVLEWTDPPYLAGHWVPELVRRAGGTPVAGIEGGRSTATDWARLADERYDVVLVSPCGYGLDDAVAQAETIRDRVRAPLLAIDSAAYVVRAGPRLVDGVEALAWAFHPDAVPAPPPGRVCSVT